MSKRRRHHRPPQRAAPQAAGDAIFKRRASTVKVRRRTDGRLELVHPPCALERAEDLEEVQVMIDEGETECAVEELLWLLEECRDFIEAQALLGEIAFAAADYPLARGHFGYAVELGWTALVDGKLSGTLAYALPANQPFFHAAKGLAACLNELNKRPAAAKVLREMMQWDPADPLGGRALLEAWSMEA